MKKGKETISKHGKHFEEFLKNSKYIGLNWRKIRAENTVTQTKNGQDLDEETKIFLKDIKHNLI